MSFQEAWDKGFDNSLMLDSEGNICETASGNIFWVKGNIIYTPSENLPFVPGTISKKIFGLKDYKIEQGEYKLNELNNADEIFMTNVGGIVTGVSKVENSSFNPVFDNIAENIRSQILKQIKEI
jgi:branched-subunit amino acid aminotransferase/4-amino-4-deoxychorismate lyase